MHSMVMRHARKVAKTAARTEGLESLSPKKNEYETERQRNESAIAVLIINIEDTPEEDLIRNSGV